MPLSFSKTSSRALGMRLTGEFEVLSEYEIGKFN